MLINYQLINLFTLKTEISGPNLAMLLTLEIEATVSRNKAL